MPYFKYYLNYSQRNSNLKLGLQLETLTIGVDGPSFKVSMDLTMHIGPHTNEKPYKCSQYEKTLSRNILCTRHEDMNMKILNIKGVNAANVIRVYLRK